MRLCPATDYNYTYGFVQFTDPQHAADVLAMSQHKINGTYVHVEEAGSWHQPRSKYLSVERWRQRNKKTPDIAITRNFRIRKCTITDLNDDCLREIFEYAKVLDLFSLTGVSSRFKRIAQERFAVKYKEFRLARLSEDAGKKQMIFRTEHLISFLMQFGPLIVSLEVERSSLPFLNDYALELVLAHCTDTLRKLILVNLELIREHCMLPFLAQLQKLYLVGCFFNERFATLLRGYSALTKLKFDGTYDLPLMNYNLPALESISFIRIATLPKSYVNEFLEQNPQLRKVTIIECRDIDSDVFQEIASFVPQVEKISFSQFPRNHDLSFVINANHLKKLVKLKKLKIDCAGYSIHTVFSEMVSANILLEHLHMGHCPYSQELNDAISNMKTLKTLNMLSIEEFTSSDLLSICENLPELSRLSTDCCMDMRAETFIEVVRQTSKLQTIELMRTPLEIDVKSFETILELIKKRHDSRALEIVLPASGHTVTVPGELRRTNKSIVNLVTKDSRGAEPTHGDNDLPPSGWE